MSSQFGYCCKTRTNGGIPYCPDVVNGISQVQTQEQFEEETDLQCPDTGVGCPIESIEQYFDSPSVQVSYDCQPEYVTSTQNISEQEEIETTLILNF